MNFEKIIIIIIINEMSKPQFHIHGTLWGLDYRHYFNVWNLLILFPSKVK